MKEEWNGNSGSSDGVGAGGGWFADDYGYEKRVANDNNAMWWQRWVSL